MGTAPIGIREILLDNRSGSQEITRKAATLVRQTLEESQELSVEKITHTILELGIAFILAHPAMASLFHLFNRIFLHLDTVKTKTISLNSLCGVLEDVIRKMNQQNNRAGTLLMDLLGEQSLVLTHSSSGAVKQALLQCWEAGKRFSVLCTESRPACEGSLLAQEFCQRGIPTTLVTDTLAFSFFQPPGGGERKIDLILVGADAVSTRGIINKAGTVGLAMAAKQCALPFYALAGGQKFFPKDYPVGKCFQEQPGEEILPSAPKGLTIVNRYFDLTPLDTLSGVISERGILDPAAAQKHIGNVRVHSQWMAAVLRELEAGR